MGWLPTWLKYGLVNRFTARFARFAGITPERPLPVPTTRLVRQLHPLGQGDPVLLFPDTFTNFFEPGIGLDAANVLAHLGNRVEVPSANVCCGLTWHSTGQLPKARRVVERTARVLLPWTSRGVPVIGLEPSCTAFLRAEAPKLSDDPAVRALAEATRTFAEHVAPKLPQLEGAREAVVQTHCHQYAELGFAPDRAAMAKAGLAPRIVEGCCGLAGNFGFERGHYDVSIACAEQDLLPALRDNENALVIADGFSCRTQIRHTTEREPVHLASALAALIPVQH
jgi:Fe-S oxidoreductase